MTLSLIRTSALAVTLMALSAGAAVAAEPSDTMPTATTAASKKVMKKHHKKAMKKKSASSPAPTAQ